MTRETATRNAEAREAERMVGLTDEGVATVPVLNFSGGTGPEAGAGNGEGLLRVDLDKLLASRLLIQADSGGGKSWMVRYLLEQTHGLMPQIVFDIEGEFSSLRERFPYVLVSATPGEGDLPADPRSARLLCRRLSELRASAILDLYDLDEEPQQVFVREFVTELLSLPRALWERRLVLIDEAERVAPEKGAAQSKAAVGSLVKRARKRQMGVALAIQRLSDVDKGAVGSLQNKLIGLATLDTDMRRAGDALGFDSARRKVLEELPPGHFFAHGPAIPAKGVVLVRSGPVLTTHPGDARGKAGDSLEAAETPSVPPPQESLREVLAELSGFTEEAEQEARTADELREKNRALAEEISRLREERSGPQTGSAGSAAGASRAAIRAEVEGEVREETERRLRREHRRELAEEGAKVSALEGRVRSLEKVLSESGEAARRLAEFLIGAEAKRPGAASAAPVGVPSKRAGSEGRSPSRDAAAAKAEAGRREGERRGRTPSSGSGGDGAQELPAPRRRMLAVLLSMEALGVDDLDAANLAVLSGQRPTSSRYEKHAAALRSGGLIEYVEAGGRRLTEEGRARAEDLVRDPSAGDDLLRLAEPASLADLHAAWASLLPAPQAKMLRVFVERYPEAVPFGELADLTDQSPTSSRYEKHRAAMRKLGLIVYREGGGAAVANASRLFREGLK